MKRFVLLYVDYYRILMTEDPEWFLDVVERDGFVKAICDEIGYLLDKIEKRIKICDQKGRDLLNAKVCIAMGLPQFMTDQMRNEFADSEDRTAEAQLSGSLNQLEPFQSDEIRQPFIAPDCCDPIVTDPFKMLLHVSFIMKLHGRLVSLIEETPVFKVDWDLINLNRLPLLTHHAPILGLYESPAAYNNSNYPYL